MEEREREREIERGKQNKEESDSRWRRFKISEIKSDFDERTQREDGVSSIGRSQ